MNRIAGCILLVCIKNQKKQSPSLSKNAVKPHPSRAWFYGIISQVLLAAAQYTA